MPPGGCGRQPTLFHQLSCPVAVPNTDTLEVRAATAAFPVPEAGRFGSFRAPQFFDGFRSGVRSRNRRSRRSVRSRNGCFGDVGHWFQSCNDAVWRDSTASCTKVGTGFVHGRCDSSDQHRAQKWAPVLCMDDATLQISIVHKSRHRFCAWTMRPRYQVPMTREPDRVWAANCSNRSRIRTGAPIPNQASRSSPSRGFCN